jgi:hypothetical protein
MYQRNRTVSLDGKDGKQLAWDEWVEDYLVCPVRQFASAQSSFSMVELMSCSVHLLQMKRQMLGVIQHPHHKEAQEATTHVRSTEGCSICPQTRMVWI